MHVVDLNVPGLRCGCYVTLVDDGAFLGVFVGLEVDERNQRTGRAVVSVKQPGRTLLVGDKPIATDRLVVVTAVPVVAKSATKRSVAVTTSNECAQYDLFDRLQG